MPEKPTIKYKTQKCSSPNCDNKIYTRVDGKHPSKYCKKCKIDPVTGEKVPLTVLRLQTLHELPIRELLVNICKVYSFNSGGTISMILGINKKKLEEWVKRYFNLNSWDEFKKIYKCKSNSCFIIKCSSLFSSRYQNKYYLVSKLKKDFDICSCLFKSSEDVTNDFKIIVKIQDLGKLSEIQKTSVFFYKNK